jgi:glycosyltransferase involved in cell wall biosynthesis
VNPEVAVLLPCYNEELTIARVVTSFQESLAGAVVYVYDNASNDRSAERARAAGAVVRPERRRGKGNVVRSMFADIDADVYVMTDADGTYDAAVAPLMVDRLLRERLDMVVGVRCPDPDERAYPTGHGLGNMAFSKTVRTLFGAEFTDVFSGYRVMSRRFVKSFPVTSSGFEIETELSVHAMRVNASTGEVPALYRRRQEGSSSKLRTYRDGFKILGTMVRLFEDMRPLQFFAFLAVALTIIALALGVPVVDEFRRTGLVRRYPTAFLAASVQIVAFVFLACGVILRRVGRSQAETRRLFYLQIPHVAVAGDRDAEEITPRPRLAVETAPGQGLGRGGRDPRTVKAQLGEDQVGLTVRDVGGRDP